MKAMRGLHEDAHAIAWLALEHAKGLSRCPPGHSLLIAQMAPGWSLEHWETPADQLERLVADRAVAIPPDSLWLASLAIATEAVSSAVSGWSVNRQRATTRSRPPAR